MAVDVESCSLVSSHGTRRSAARKALLVVFFFFFSFSGKYFLWLLSAIRRCTHPPHQPPIYPPLEPLSTVYCFPWMSTRVLASPLSLFVGAGPTLRNLNALWWGEALRTDG